MIKFLLQELEKSSHPTFSKNELLKISKKEFTSLKSQGIIAYRQPDLSGLETIRYPRCPYGCGLTIQETELGYEAFCLDHPEEDPIIIEQDDLPRYEFVVEAFLERIRQANEISGEMKALDGGAFYLGLKMLQDNRIGVIFVPRMEKGKFLELMGLKYLFDEENYLMVLTPVSLGIDPIFKNRLNKDRIIRAPLMDSLNYKTFELPIEALISEFEAKIAVAKGTIFEHSPNYSSVKIRGEEFDLNEGQAKVIKYLHGEHEAGTKYVKQQDMKNGIYGKDSLYQRKLGEIFRGNEKAMKKLIVSGKNKRFIRLNLL